MTSIPSATTPEQRFYTAYGVPILSELPLPELLTAEDSSTNGDKYVPDDGPIRICLGRVPERLQNPSGRGVLYQANAERFLLHMHGVARYLVENGSQITVQPEPDALSSDVRVFLLGTCLGALLHQRGMLVLHASAIWTPRGAVLFTGVSGAGKSTLLAEMMARGHRMMVDDVCGIVLDATGKPVVLPAYPRTRLWADAAQKLELSTDDLPRTRPDLEKFDRQVSEQFHNRPAPPRHIYHLTRHNRDDLLLEPLPRIKTFGTVLHNTYRHIFLDALEMRTPHFHLVSAVATNLSVTRVTRPSGGFRLRELADRIEADLQSP